MGGSAIGIHTVLAAMHTTNSPIIKLAVVASLCVIAFAFPTNEAAWQVDQVVAEPDGSEGVILTEEGEQPVAPINKHPPQLKKISATEKALKAAIAYEKEASAKQFKAQEKAAEDIRKAKSAQQAVVSKAHKAKVAAVKKAEEVMKKKQAAAEVEEMHAVGEANKKEQVAVAAAGAAEKKKEDIAKAEAKKATDEVAKARDAKAKAVEAEWKAKHEAETRAQAAAKTKEKAVKAAEIKSYKDTARRTGVGQPIEPINAPHGYHPFTNEFW